MKWRNADYSIEKRVSAFISDLFLFRGEKIIILTILSAMFPDSMKIIASNLEYFRHTPLPFSAGLDSYQSDATEYDC